MYINNIHTGLERQEDSRLQESIQYVLFKCNCPWLIIVLE